MGAIGSGEKGTNTTVMLCASADGNLIPLMFVFPRVKVNADLLRGAPVGSTEANNKSGWMVIESFIHWLKHFINFSASSKSNKSLLVLDGHSTHDKSIDAINIARENGVYILCLPPHCTHRMQPLDVSCMKPLSSAFAREVQLWHRENPSNILKINHITEIFCKAYTASIGPAVVLSGFSKCGIWPLKPEIFDDCFTSAHQSSVVHDSDPEVSPNAKPVDSPDAKPEASPDSVPATCASTDINELATEPELDKTITVLPQDIIPVPKIVYKNPKKKMSRKRRRKRT